MWEKRHCGEGGLLSRYHSVDLVERASVLLVVSFHNNELISQLRSPFVGSLKFHVRMRKMEQILPSGGRIPALNGLKHTYLIRHYQTYNHPLPPRLLYKLLFYFFFFFFFMSPKTIVFHRSLSTNSYQHLHYVYCIIVPNCLLVFSS